MVSTFGANHVGRGSNPTNRLLGRWFNGRKPSWPITPASSGVVGSGSSTPHYCPDVPNAMLKSGLSGSGQWTHLRVPFFYYQKKQYLLFFLDGIAFQQYHIHGPLIRSFRLLFTILFYDIWERFRSILIFHLFLIEFHIFSLPFFFVNSVLFSLPLFLRVWEIEFHIFSKPESMHIYLFIFNFQQKKESNTWIL